MEPYSMLNGEIGWLTSALLIIAGIITIFAGKFLLRMLIGGVFGVLLGYIVAKIVLFINGEFLAALVLGFLAFIIGFFLGWFIFKLAISIVVGFLIGLLISMIMGFFNNIPMLILTVLISIGIGYILAEKLMSLLVAIAGTALFYAGVFFLIKDPLISLYITLAFIALIIINKLSGKKKR